MKAQWLGEPSGPDEITMHGFTFERKGEPVEIPDNHPHASKFVSNPFFKVQTTAKIPAEIAPPAEDDEYPEGDADPVSTDEATPPKSKGGRPRKTET